MSSLAGKSEAQVLHSELAQFCLPAARRDSHQMLAWVNSLCLVFVSIGVMGLHPPAPVIRVVQPLEQPFIEIIEPAAVVTLVESEAPPEDLDVMPPELSDAPALVAVTLESPAVVFSVPTVGNLLVSSSVAQAPPLRPMQTQVERLSQQVIHLRLTGRAGGYPQPDYPYRLQQARMEGTVVLLITVDDAGSVVNIEVKQSSGHVQLDNHTVNHVRRRFAFPAGQGSRVYQLPVVYTLP